jgi:TRAP-type C4-dicarboxylate transport system permease small subunit
VAEAHQVVGAIAIAICALAALIGGYAYWRRRGAGRLTTHALALAQTALVAQVGIGLLLLSGGNRAADDLHYAYGSLALGAALAPWFYAPAAGSKRLLWFAGTTALAAALGIRAFMTGSA